MYRKTTLRNGLRIIAVPQKTSQTVTVNGETYTVELIGASDTAATIKVTDSAGDSTSKEITEDNSKKVQGIDIAIDRCCLWCRGSSGNTGGGRSNALDTRLDTCPGANRRGRGCLPDNRGQ